MVRKLRTSLLAIAALVPVMNMVCQAQSQPPLTRHVRDVVLNGQAESVGLLPPTQPMREPTPDLPVPLWHISGLDNYSIPRPLLVRRNPEVRPDSTTGSCPSVSFCGSDMRAAYYGGTALTGKGQSLGLLEFAGIDLARPGHILHERGVVTAICCEAARAGTVRG
jgi:hypothetical protein